MITNIGLDFIKQAQEAEYAPLTIKEAALLGTMGNLIGKGIRNVVPGMNAAFTAAKRFAQPYATKAVNMAQPYANKAMSAVQPYASKAYNAVQPYASRAYNFAQPYAQQAMNRVTNFARTGVNDLRNGFNQGYRNVPVQGI